MGLALALGWCGAGPGCDGASRLSYCRLSHMLPDSLTTWEIHAVSLSGRTGEMALPGPPPHLFPPDQGFPLSPLLFVQDWGQTPGDVCTGMCWGGEAREWRQVGGRNGSPPAPPSWDPVAMTPPGLWSPPPLLHPPPPSTRPVCGHAGPDPSVPGIPPAPPLACLGPPL